jgi:hypothetical protein
VPECGAAVRPPGRRLRGGAPGIAGSVWLLLLPALGVTGMWECGGASVLVF